MAGAHSGLISETVKVSQSLKSFFEGTLFLFFRADAIATKWHGGGAARPTGISLGNIGKVCLRHITLRIVGCHISS